MSKRERKQLDDLIKYYQRKNRPHEVDRLIEKSNARLCKVFHHRKRVSYNGGLFVLTGSTKLGTIVGIDKQYYNVAYSFNAITYGKFPVAVPNDNEVAGMKLSTTLNCVAQQVIKHFKGSKRSAGLTEIRAKQNYRME